MVFGVSSFFRVGYSRRICVSCVFRMYEACEEGFFMVWCEKWLCRNICFVICVL